MAQDSRIAPSQLLEEANAHYLALRPEEAARLYREYLKSNPDRADVRVYLGAALLNLNRLSDALAEARRAIALDANMAKALVLAGRIYAEQQQWTVAQEFFARATKADPSDRDAWYFSGRAFYEAAQFDKAIEAFLRAGSGSSRVHQNLGLAYEAAGKVAEADAAYKLAIKLANGAYRPHLAYGVFLFKQGRLTESVPVLTEAMRLDPESVDVRFELGRALYQAGRLTEAFSVLGIAVPPDQCRVHNLRGRIATRLDRPAEAQKEFDTFRACVQSNPANQR